MASISVAGLSDETVALLTRRARERGVDVTAVVRELADLGLRLELAPAPPPATEMTARPPSTDPIPGLARDLLGCLETDDPDYLWS